MKPRHPDPRIARLAQLAAMIRDAQAMRTREALQSSAETRARLAALDLGAQTALVDDLARLQAGLLHDRWVAPRRAELNGRLAAQLAILLAEQDKTRTAFGRAAVLARLGGGDPG